MSWIRRLFGVERKGSTLADPSPELMIVFGAWPNTVSKKVVTPRSALQVPAVACAVRAIAEPFLQLPMHVYRRGPDGARSRDTEHAVARLMSKQANGWTGAGELRAQMAVDALLHGNGRVFINRVNGKPHELIRLKPGAVQVVEDDATGEPHYVVSTRDGQRRLARGDVLDLRCVLSHDGLIGESPINLAREAIGIAMVLEETTGRVMHNALRPSGVFKMPMDASADTLLKAKAALEAQFGGPEHAGRPIVSPGADYTPFEFKFDEAQLLELRKYCVDEVSRAFRVPPHLLFEMGRATWGNAEELGAAFLTYGLMPWLEAFEDQVNRFLFTEDERDEYFAEFVVDDLLRADFSKRAEGVSKLVAARIMSPNEARAIGFNLAPYEGGEEFVNPNTTPAPAPREAA